MAISFKVEELGLFTIVTLFDTYDLALLHSFTGWWSVDRSNSAQNFSQSLHINQM
jgi:hypothetical protein